MPLPARLFRLAAALALLATLALPAAAAVWRVKAGESIQAAIDRAAPGDTIEVERARYVENLLITRPLTLRGIDRPTISGGLRGDTIRIKAEHVTIEGLIIADSGASLREQNAGIYVWPGSHHTVIRNCDFSYTLFGLWIEQSNDVLIEGNLITGKRELRSSQRGNGIQLYNTRRARIIGNN
ncbi:right-handed parallel beta-helix repeat-containing protein, partial [Thauera butanivorans]|uniref:right-handed parallel beta-helix repeat-containing protein n=1 Tax=Thauera butanivorans TaxID=86174 RepID=UPI000B10D739